jgi:PAS domain S-box-containing protein
MNTLEDTPPTLIDAIPTMAWASRPDGYVEFLNRRCLEYMGLSLHQARGSGWDVAVHPDDLDALMERWGALLASGEAGEMEARVRRHDGEYRRFLFRAEPVRDAHGNIVKWYGANTDIEDRKRAESLLAAEKRTLEMIAGGAPLIDIIKTLCDTIDDQSPKIISTVMLLDRDGTRLWPVPGRRVPQGWIEAISPVPIAPNLGACSSAVLLKQRVIAADIAAESADLPYGDIALSNGLRAAWSQPLLSKSQEVLGTFAMFYAEPRSPSESDLRLIEGAGHIAVIAIEGERSQEALRSAFEEVRNSETRLRKIIDTIPTLAWCSLPDGTGIFWNRRWHEYTGLSLDVVRGWGWQDAIHPEDLKEITDKWLGFLAAGQPGEVEGRLRRFDGVYRWFLFRAEPLRDESDNIVNWYGTDTDIDDLKRAEAKLRKDEEELRRMTDAIPQTIIVFNPDGKAIYANRVALEYTGLSLDDVQTDDFRARVFHPDDVQRLREERYKALSDTAPFENEERALGKDGKYRWFLIRYNPLLEESGKVIRWYATGTDIDDRKQAEERTRRENLALREEIDQSSMFEEIVGSSESLRHVLTQVAKVAPTDSTVLISGDTGTGKELIARAIHKRSNRSTRAFIVVNCAAIPQSLIASELFGHEKGAFTGALQRRMGRFEAADGGTIFLDEIGELPVEMQVALLRVLQEQEFERIGGTESIKVNVRVLAATNRNLERAVGTGTFREDLFYRLNVFPIRVPPLRERGGDIPLLVEYLIDRYGKKAGKKFRAISKKTLELFETYDWPGNVRELQNVIERAVVLRDGETFSIDETWLKRTSRRPPGPEVPLIATVAAHERELIEAALAKSKGRIAGASGAAAKLGIPRQTLESKIQSFGIDKHRFRNGLNPEN